MQVIRSGGANVRSDQVRLSPLPQASAGGLLSDGGDGLTDKTDYAPEGVATGGFPCFMECCGAC